MRLPTERKKPSLNLSSLIVLLYGGYKVGKSTFCNQFPAALFLATEPGLNSLDTRDVNITSWDDMLEACALIAEGNHDYDTIVIDTIDNAWKLCTEYVCKANKIAYEGDLDYGKGHALVAREFNRVITKLAQLPYGLWMISHAKATTVEGRTNKYTKIIPTLPDRAHSIIGAMADLVLYASMDERMHNGVLVQTRTIYTKPNLYWEAGDRTGRLPEQMAMDYNEFVSSFDPFADTAEEREIGKPKQIIDDVDALNGIDNIEITVTKNTKQENM